jgi:excisionase family DNA binding protein
MPHRMSSDRVLLSTAEASSIAHLGREYIQRLLRQGRLEGIKLGHDWLVYEDSLQSFLAQPRKTGPKGPRKQSLQQQSGGTSPTTNEQNGQGAQV